jgi:hypothetical protein
MDVHISGRSQRIERAWNVIHAALVEGQKPTTNTGGEEIAEMLLGDLLAVIHRDGGQYTGQHGLEKSVRDAIEVVVQLLHA